MKAHLKTVYSESHQIVDSETGELLDIQTKETRVLTQTREEFIQVYTAVESKLASLSPSEERVWTYCILNCDKENLIRLNSFDKEKILQKWGVASSTTANAVKALITAGLLIRVGRGTYRINPRYSWKGNSNDRRQALKYVLEVECPTC